MHSLSQILLSKLTKVITLHKTVNDLHLHLALDLSLKLKLELNIVLSTHKKQRKLTINYT